MQRRILKIIGVTDRHRTGCIRTRSAPRRLAALLLSLLFVFSVGAPAAAGTVDPGLKLTAKEISWLKENGEKIRYGPNPYWPPGDYMENGEHKGIVSDYIKIFEKKLGITFKRVYYDNWESFYHGMMTGGFDLVGAAQKTKERQKVLVFTKPFLTTRLAVLTRTSYPELTTLGDLNAMTLAGIKGYSSLDYVISHYPGATILPCEDDLTVLLKVSAGAADGAVVDYMMASYLIDKYSITNLKYASELDFHWDLRFAINKKMPLLRSILDKVLATITETEQQKIYHKWVTLNLKNKPSFIEQHLKLILGLFFLILCVLFMVILFNRSLKKQVAVRTEALNKNALKLQESKEYLQALLDSTGDGIIVTDADSGKNIDVNHRMTELFGYSREDARQVSFDALGPGEPPFSREDARKWLRKARDDGPQTFDWLAGHKDGQTFWTEVKISPAVIGGADRFVIVIRDITRRKQIEEQLIKAQKLEALGVLAGGIAHDFNNILFPIMGFSEILLDDLPPESPEYQDALEILNAGMRGSDLAKQILAFSRQTEQKKVPIQIQPVLKEAIKLSRSTIPADIHIIQDLQNDCSLVKADPTQIHQIAMNLITNAYHAVEPESGEIAIRLSEVELEFGQRPDIGLPPGRYALLSVSDTGTGVDPEIIHKIFEPYFTTKAPGKGTGLGLALVYGIVKKHHGDVGVTSELGKGTTFDVYLPVMVQSAQAESGEGEEKAPIGTERVLLVDDEAAIAKLEKKMLERQGYTVAMYESSLNALEAFRAKPASFDIVVSDMTMPGMTGDRLARELTAIRPDIPIIICTGFSERLHQENAEKTGVTCFLKKPIAKAEMANMVRMVLDSAKENGNPVSCPSPFD